jgi:glycolate oxidase FAD binding subunit
VRVIDGRGQDLRFGGRVMKNVAGYDVSRLMVGAQGALGVVLEVSMKVLPAKPEMTLRFEGNEVTALDTISRWIARELPVSATCQYEQSFHVRFTGAEPTLRRVRAQTGGESVTDGEGFWRAIRDHTADYFRCGTTLWRISVPVNAPPLGIADQLLEWGGALRWLSCEIDAADLRAQVERLGGHATLFRSTSHTCPVFHPLKPPLASVHRELQRVFDPGGILNVLRMHSGYANQHH